MISDTKIIMMMIIIIRRMIIIVIIIIIVITPWLGNTGLTSGGEEPFLMGR